MSHQRIQQPPGGPKSGVSTRVGETAAPAGRAVEEKGASAGAPGIQAPPASPDTGRAQAFWEKFHARAAQAPVPPPADGGASVFGLVLEKQRDAHLASLPEGELRDFRQHLFLQRLARVLGQVPHGATADQRLQALRDDPHLHALAPELTLEDVHALTAEQRAERARYYEPYGGEQALHDHKLPDSIAKLTGIEAVDAKLDRMRAMNDGPGTFVPHPLWPSLRLYDEVFPSPEEAVVDLSVSEAVFGDAGKADAARRYGSRWMSELRRNQWRLGDTPPELHVLRHTLANAPPHWPLERIAGAHNEHADFYAPFTDGPKTFDATELRHLLATRPQALGADEFFSRRRRFLGEVREELVASKPGENVYAVLRRICDRLRTRSDVAATVTPEELFEYIQGDEELRAQLDQNFERSRRALKDELYPELAEQVVSVFGDKLHQFSLHEIAQRMRLDDSSFSEGLLVDLVAECPEVFGTEPFSKAQRNFVLATQVAQRMHWMWPGATYDDVARFMVSLGPLGQVPPDFSGRDVELLQGYDFMPRWPQGVKPDTEAELQLAARSALLRELDVPLSLLAPEDSRALRDAVISSLVHAPERTELDPELSAGISRAYARSLRHRIFQLFETYPPKKGDVSASSPDRAELFAYLDGDRSMDSERLTELLKGFGNGCRVEEPTLVAKLLEGITLGDLDALVTEQPWLGRLRIGSGDLHPTDLELQMLLHSYRAGERDLRLSVEVQGFRNQELRQVLQRYARIPLVLPTTQGIAEQVKQEYSAAKRPLPLAGTRVVMIQHELGQAYPQVNAFREVGMDPSKCIFVGVPYNPNEEVEESLIRAAGVDGRFADRGDLAALHRNIEQAVDDALAAREDGERVLIVCDGPYARRYFEQKYLSQDASLQDVVRFTEQTARGDRPEDRQRTNMRVVSYARHPQKVREAPYIGRAAIRAVTTVMHLLRDTPENKRVLVKALGPVGRAAAEAAKAAGAIVEGWDPEVTEEIRAWAKAHDVPLVEDPEAAAKQAYLVMGGAGRPSIDAPTIDAAEGLQYYVSLSSELLEIDIRHLQERATDAEGRLRKTLGTEVNGQPTDFYWLDDGTVRVVVGGGLPVNFNDVNSVAPEIIDFTMALSVAAAVETMEAETLGYHTLSRFSDELSSAYEAYLAQADGRGASGEPAPG